MIQEVTNAAVAKLLKLNEGYLHDVGPELGLIVRTLDLGDLQDSGGQGVVVHPPAGPQSGGQDGWLGYQVHGNQVSHSLQRPLR